MNRDFDSLVLRSEKHKFDIITAMKTETVGGEQRETGEFSFLFEREKYLIVKRIRSDSTGFISCDFDFVNCVIVVGLIR